MERNIRKRSTAVSTTRPPYTGAATIVSSSSISSSAAGASNVTFDSDIITVAIPSAIA